MNGVSEETKYNVKIGHVLNPSTAESQVCKEWNEVANGEINTGFVLVNSFSLLIVCVSFISRKIYVYLISKIKLRRISQEKNIGMYSTLLIYFCNYGLMYLIAPWNFIDQKDIKRDGEEFLTGYYNDFSAAWHIDIGYTILTT